MDSDDVSIGVKLLWDGRFKESSDFLAAAWQFSPRFALHYCENLYVRIWLHGEKDIMKSAVERFSTSENMVNMRLSQLRKLAVQGESDSIGAPSALGRVVGGVKSTVGWLVGNTVNSYSNSNGDVSISTETSSENTDLEIILAEMYLLHGVLCIWYGGGTITGCSLLRKAHGIYMKYAEHLQQEPNGKTESDVNVNGATAATTAQPHPQTQTQKELNAITLHHLKFGTAFLQYVIARLSGTARRIIDATIGIIVDTDHDALSILGKLQRDGGRRAPFASAILLSVLLDEIPEFENDAHRNEAARKIVSDCLAAWPRHSVWHYFAHKLAKIEYPFALSFSTASGKLRQCVSSLKTAYQNALVECREMNDNGDGECEYPPSSLKSHVFPHMLRLCIMCVCITDYDGLLRVIGDDDDESNLIPIDNDSDAIYKFIFPFLQSVANASIGHIDMAAEIMATEVLIKIPKGDTSLNLSLSPSLSSAIDDGEGLGNPSSMSASMSAKQSCVDEYIGSARYFLERVSRYEPLPSPLLLGLEAAYHFDSLSYVPRVMDVVTDLDGINEADLNGFGRDSAKYARYLLVKGVLLMQVSDQWENARKIFGELLTLNEKETETEKENSETSLNINIVACAELECGVVCMYLQKFDDSRRHLDNVRTLYKKNVKSGEFYLAPRILKRYLDAKNALRRRVDAIKMTYLHARDPIHPYDDNITHSGNK